MQRMIRFYQSELQTLAKAVAEAPAAERFTLLYRMNKLKQVLILMEEVDLSIEQLMKKVSNFSVSRK